MIPYIPFEPIIRVGLCEDSPFGLVPQGAYRIEASEDSVIYTPEEDTAAMTVKGMQIGRDFHWQQNLDLRFAGIISLRRHADHSLLLNLVKAETYLESVVGSEMNPAAPEALIKAHAIISRSWLFRQIHYQKQQHTTPLLHTPECVMQWSQADAHSDFDVCPDDHCQRYQGLDAVTPASAEAVRQTRGLVLTDEQGDIIDARFSKCCGGKTELFSTCWDDIDFPYLQCVDDPYCHPARLRKHDISSLIKHYDALTEDYFEWQQEVPAELIQKNLKEKLNIDIGRIIALTPLKRGTSGRICRLRISGTGGEVEVGKELLIRRLLSDKHLYSSAFEIDKTSHSGFMLRGRGWGHGVGLCQIGAAVMAAEGHSAEAILQHYYPNTRITRLYD